MQLWPLNVRPIASILDYQTEVHRPKVVPVCLIETLPGSPLAMPAAQTWANRYRSNPAGQTRCR